MEKFNGHNERIVENMADVFDALQKKQPIDLQSLEQVKNRFDVLAGIKEENKEENKEKNKEENKEEE